MSLKKVFDEIHSNQLPAPLAPAVDFERFLVIVAILDEKPTAGYQISITRVSQRQQAMQVEVHVENPRPDRLLAAVVTQPYVMIKVEKNPSLDTVEFVGENRVVLQTVSLRR